MGRRIIWGRDKSLRVAVGFMIGLGTSAALDKKLRLDANNSLNRKRGLFPKPEKRSRGISELGSRGGVSVTALGKKKGDAGRPRAGKKCWITRLETTAVDVNNFRDLTMLLS